MTIWFDVEDLVRYFDQASRPTGIQRLSFEIYRQLSKLDDQVDIRFCRRGGSKSGFRSIHFPAFEAGIITAASIASPHVAAPEQPGISYWAVLGRSLPKNWRRPLGEILYGFACIYKGWRGLLQACIAALVSRPSNMVQIGGHQFDIAGADVVFAPNDWFVHLGAPWNKTQPAGLLQTLHEAGTSYAVVIYDLIPELFPEWTDLENARLHQAWLRGVLPAADTIFTISHTTAKDISQFQKSLGLVAPKPVILPIGNLAAQPCDTVGQPIQKPFVLLVSTIEVRKNHILMFRVWRRLLQKLPAGQVPDLVFAGKMGWLTEDFYQQMENTGWLNGKIKFIPSPSEPELATLYQNCLFTVFPSFYEGWGLPITESLSFGKTVAASNRGAIPEAGGEFCSYFDPDDLNNAYNVISGLIKHPDRIATLERRIAADFKPKEWSETALAILQSLNKAHSPALPLEAETVGFMATAISQR